MTYDDNRILTKAMFNAEFPYGEPFAFSTGGDRCPTRSEMSSVAALLKKPDGSFFEAENQLVPYKHIGNDVKAYVPGNYYRSAKLKIDEYDNGGSTGHTFETGVSHQLEPGFSSPADDAWIADIYVTTDRPSSYPYSFISGLDMTNFLTRRGRNLVTLNELEFYGDLVDKNKFPEGTKVTVVGSSGSNLTPSEFYISGNKTVGTSNFWNSVLKSNSGLDNEKLTFTFNGMGVNKIYRNVPRITDSPTYILSLKNVADPGNFIYGTSVLYNLNYNCNITYEQSNNGSYTSGKPNTNPTLTSYDKEVSVEFSPNKGFGVKDIQAKYDWEGVWKSLGIVDRPVAGAVSRTLHVLGDTDIKVLLEKLGVSIKINTWNNYVWEGYDPHPEELSSYVEAVAYIFNDAGDSREFTVPVTGEFLTIDDKYKNRRIEFDMSLTDADTARFIPANLSSNIPYRSDIKIETQYNLDITNALGSEPEGGFFINAHAEPIYDVSLDPGNPTATYAGYYGGAVKENTLDGPNKGRMYMFEREGENGLNIYVDYGIDYRLSDTNSVSLTTWNEQDGAWSSISSDGKNGFSCTRDDRLGNFSGKYDITYGGQGVTENIYYGVECGLGSDGHKGFRFSVPPEKVVKIETNFEIVTNPGVKLTSPSSPKFSKSPSQYTKFDEQDGTYVGKLTEIAKFKLESGYEKLKKSDFTVTFDDVSTTSFDINTDEYYGTTTLLEINGDYLQNSIGTGAKDVKITVKPRKVSIVTYEVGLDLAQTNEELAIGNPVAVVKAVGKAVPSDVDFDITGLYIDDWEGGYSCKVSVFGGLGTSFEYQEILTPGGDQIPDGIQPGSVMFTESAKIISQDPNSKFILKIYS